MSGAPVGANKENILGMLRWPWGMIKYQAEAREVKNKHKKFEWVGADDSEDRPECVRWVRLRQVDRNWQLVAAVGAGEFAGEGGGTSVHWSNWRAGCSSPGVYSSSLTGSCKSTTGQKQQWVVSTKVSDQWWAGSRLPGWPNSSPAGFCRQAPKLNYEATAQPEKLFLVSLSGHSGTI